MEREQASPRSWDREFVEKRPEVSVPTDAGDSFTNSKSVGEDNAAPHEEGKRSSGTQAHAPFDDPAVAITDISPITAVADFHSAGSVSMQDRDSEPWRTQPQSQPRDSTARSLWERAQKGDAGQRVDALIKSISNRISSMAMDDILRARETRWAKNLREVLDQRAMNLAHQAFSKVRSYPPKIPWT